MPLSNIFKNIIGSTNKLNQLNNVSTTPKTTTPTSKRHSSLEFLTTPLKNDHQNRCAKTLSQINSLRSHRNLKPAYQMLLAESMYDPEISISLDSCLAYTFQQCVSENQILPCFVQFMESMGKQTNKIIKCFLQANCLEIFIKDMFEEINLIDLDDDNESSSNRNLIFNDIQKENFVNFKNDFLRLFNHFLIRTDQNIDCDNFLDPNVYEKLENFFENQKDANHYEEQFMINSFRIFNLFYKNLYSQIETNYYEKFLRSNFFLKYQYEILKSLKFSLSDVLFSDTPITFLFLDFMNSEGMKRYVDFLLIYRNYKTFSCQYNDALAIHNRFFNYTNNFNSYLNPSDKVLNDLNESIKSNDCFKPECYDKFALILLQYFSKTYFPQFLESNIFQEYLQNCDVRFNAIDINSNETPKCRQTTRPDYMTRSHDHIIDNNSLFKAHSETNLNCDQEAALWDRNLKGHLQFTYIDKYGRMNSSLEPEPNIKNDTKLLSQFFRKISFNSTNEDKTKQDDAWKIAESIINDVCSSTNQHSPRKEF